MIYVGTFSKLLYPGLRIGYIAASDDLHPQLVRIVLARPSERSAAFDALSVSHQVLTKPCEPAALRATGAAWRVSVLAGATGAFASAGWFTAFALTSAANVRTLGMVEVVFSYLVSHRLLREKLTGAEKAGLLLVLVGVGALLLA